MATTNNRRDVKLGVEVETSGQENLKGLAADVRAVGTAAGDSAPGVDRLTKELATLTAATASRRDAERAARTEEAAARVELDARRDALARLRAGADAATKATVEHQSAVRVERLAVVEANIAMRERRTALAAAVQDARQAATAERAVADQLARTSLAHAAASTAQVSGNSAVAKSLGDIKGQLGALQSVAIAAAGGSLIGSLAKDVAAVAEGYQSLSARLKIATADTGDFKAVFQGVFDVANRTGVAVDEVGALVTKLILSGKEIGVTNQQALGLAETLTQALRVGGASAQEAASSVTQFAQAMASGKLAGDELKSILENSPRLAKALADGLGVSIGKLKDLGAAGALTSAQVVAALQGQSGALQSEFDKMPVTVSRALANLSNAWAQYIGQANEGGSATGAAAAAIQALARNLDTVASLLYSAGKAAAAFYAVKLAAAFLETAAAASRATIATAEATAATVAHTVATRANAAAQGEAAAGAGRWASIIGGLKVAGLLTVLTNMREIGTAIGDGAARLLGYGKALDDVERAARADAESTRRLALERTALSQATQQATDRALGLTDAARKIVAEFDGVIVKGETTADALDKVSKSLRLDNLSGIQAAGAALDALGVRGKLSAEQIKDALSGALKGADLLAFETTARAAFDSSEQGARRLKAALDAIADESLRRAGTSVEELKNGFSLATTSAINDVDTLARTLRSLGVTGEEASRALSVAIDKALSAANTERAVRAVLDRVEDLGKAGLLAGDRLTEGLEKARKKLDDIRPGVNSLAEAMRAFGLETREQLQQTADRLDTAYRTIATSAGVSLRDQIDAYAKWRAAALAASGDVESAHLAEQRVILETRATVAGLGEEFVRAMTRAEQATRSTGAAVRAETACMAAGFDHVAAAADGASRSILASTQYDKNKFALGADGQRLTAGGQLTPPDSSGNWEFVGDVRVGQATGTTYGFTDQRGNRGLGVAVSRQGYWKQRDGAGGAPAPVQAPAAAPVAAPSSAGRTVTINLAGLGSTSVRVASDADAERLAAMLRQLETAMARSAS